MNCKDFKVAIEWNDGYEGECFDFEMTKEQFEEMKKELEQLGYEVRVLEENDVL